MYGQLLWKPLQISKINRILSDRLQKFPDNFRIAFITLIISIGAALSAVAFMHAINSVYSLTYESFVDKSPLFFLISSFCVISISSLTVGYLLNVYSKEAAGSGIPQIKSAYWKELGFISFKTVIIKFIAGVLSIGGGQSLGREGPSVYLGSGVASNLDGLLGSPARQRRAATVVGASAALAAAFNTPIAAITFAIEEILGDLNNRYLGRVVLAAVVGALVVYAILGSHPAFIIPDVEDISWFHYAVVPFVALTASIFGAIFQRATLIIRSGVKKQKKIPAWLMPLIGGIITWIIGSTIFLNTGRIGIFGLGYNDLSQTLNNNIAWQIAGILVIGKLIATIASYGFGAAGGIFSPSLFIGGLTGYFIAGFAGQWVPITVDDKIVLVAVGMSACLGAIVKAPLTSILIVFEMTHQFSFIPGLMIGTIISQSVSHLFNKLNFYDKLLVQDGHELHKIRPPADLQAWQNLPIGVISNPNIVGLHKLDQNYLQMMIHQYPYNAFPIFLGDQISGIATREQIIESISKKITLEYSKVVFCFSHETVRDVGNRFIESSANVLIVKDISDKITGIITLHDLLRAQAAINH